MNAAAAGAAAVTPASVAVSAALTRTPEPVRALERGRRYDQAARVNRSEQLDRLFAPPHTVCLGQLAGVRGIEPVHHQRCASAGGGLDSPRALQNRTSPCGEIRSHPLMSSGSSLSDVMASSIEIPGPTAVECPRPAFGARSPVWSSEQAYDPPTAVAPCGRNHRNHNCCEFSPMPQDVVGPKAPSYDMLCWYRIPESPRWSDGLRLSTDGPAKSGRIQSDPAGYRVPIRVQRRYDAPECSGDDRAE